MFRSLDYFFPATAKPTSYKFYIPPHSVTKDMLTTILFFFPFTAYGHFQTLYVSGFMHLHLTEPNTI